MEFKILIKTPIYNALSDLGKRIFLPQGIFYWSGRAKTEAEINGTIGTAFGFEKDFIDGGSEEWLPCYLKDIKNYSKLSIKEMVPYASIGGLPEMREIWKMWIIKKSLYDVDKEKEKFTRLEKYITLPLITAGVTNGIYLSCALFLNPGEFIIAPNKRWENYDTLIKKNLNAKIKSFEFFEKNSMNIQGLIKAIEEVAAVQEKIILILNFPNNPTGYIPTKEEEKNLIESLRNIQKKIKKPIIIFIDDAYEPYAYSEDVIDKSIFYNLHQLDEDIIPIKLDGITKELLMYGARIGFITVGLKPKWIENDDELTVLKTELINKLEGMNRSTISNCNHFYQALSAKIFNEVGINKIIESRNKVNELLRKRYEKINDELSKLKNENISVDPNGGGFFLFINLNPKIKATEVADLLLKKYKVGIIPAEKPKENINGLRIAYCSIDVKKIPEFVQRINSAINDF